MSISAGLRSHWLGGKTEKLLVAEMGLQAVHGWLAQNMVDWLFSLILGDFNPTLKLRAEEISLFVSCRFQSKKNPVEFAQDIVKEADQYNGFNLILVDFFSKTMVYVTNRPKDALITEVSPGIHVLSNSNLDAPWPKQEEWSGVTSFSWHLKSLTVFAKPSDAVWKWLMNRNNAERLRHCFREVLDKYGETELPIKMMVEKLMRDMVKDEESELPHIYPPQLEYHLSSIFVDVDRPLGRYCTRSTSAVYMKSSGETWFYEKYVEKDLWKEQSLIYQIEKME